LFLSLSLTGCGSSGRDNRFAAVSKDAPPASLSVLSANLHRNRSPADMRLLAANVHRDLSDGPDFVLCQEVMFSPLGPAQSSAAALARGLNYHWAGNPRGAISAEGSAILSRYPFIYSSRWRLGFRRMSVMGEFDVPGIGRVRVINVHFQDKPAHADNRRAQLAETLRWIEARERRCPATITILGGDFNAEPDAPEFAALFSPESATSFQSFNTKRLSTLDKTLRRRVLRLDNIYIASSDPNLIGDGVERVLWPVGLSSGDGRWLYVSDHLPILHVYSLNKDALSIEHRLGSAGG
jgi:endonuclease/exonuclease/phosphatase family metal-dependent hydrolase